ncbi:ABC transporter ATP-binding protein [Streptomyces rimosus]|uniref:ABC transporter ATP-binding protein n=1 Tax=Streptomyces rimosus TaxID=1927 RepID=UPI0004C5097F|nr:ABC transporter ATP-binding protein [Streptomyces rimosus]
MTPAHTPPSRPDNQPAAAACALTKVHDMGGHRVTALNKVTLDIPRGHFTAIMGPSGSGKSTLMHCLAGLDSPSSGTAWIGEVNLTELSDRQLTLMRRDRIGFIFQAFHLLPTLTVMENITLPMTLAGKRPDPQWLTEVIGTLGLHNRLTHRPPQLSGGQQQRVACARAMLSQPEIIFADEPTGNLDSRAGAEVLQLLQESVRRLGQTIVMVTHDPVAASCTDRAVFLADGRIVDELQQPTRDRVLGRMRLFDATDST